jgi:hypothetical protein
MRRRATLVWTFLAIGGVIVVAGMTLAASRLSALDIGLSSEPLQAGQALAPTPTAAPKPKAKPKAKRTPRKTPTPVATPTAVPTVIPTAVPTVDDHSGSSGGGGDDSGGDDHGSGGHGADD